MICKNNITICNNNNKNNNKNNNNKNNNNNNNTFMIAVTDSNLIISGQCSDHYQCCKCCQ